MQQQGGLGGQNKELGQRALGDQQDLIEVVDIYDPKSKEPTEALPATQLKTNKHRFQLRGICSRQLTGCQTKTAQYRVV
jgi:hypothetical protein